MKVSTFLATAAIALGVAPLRALAARDRVFMNRGTS
jgi:hypothetical protein